MDAHDPYLPPPPFDLKFAPKRPQDPYARNDPKITPEEIRELRDAYDSTIAYLDHQVGLLFDEIEKRGLLKNTLIIITSDHGELFGEHGLLSHGNSLYRPLLHVPLLISYPPDVPSDRRIYNPVTLADLPATVMEIVGLEGGPEFPGASLAHHWAQEQSPTNSTRPLLSEVSQLIRKENWLPASQGSMKSLLDGRWHFILHEKLGTELYDWENDPQELHNLAEKPEMQAVIAKLRRQLPRFPN